MRLLITGASGFLGLNLVRQLIRQGHHLVILKRRSSAIDALEQLGGILAFYDIEDGIPAVFNGEPIDGVIHLATCYGRNGENSAELLSVNTLFPLQVLEAAVAAGVSLFMNTDTALDKSLNAYSISKRQFSEWGAWFAKNKNLTFINIRLEHMFGPGDANSKFTAYVIHALANHQPEVNLTKGEQLRDFIYIDDVLFGYQVLLKNFCSGIIRGYIDCDMGSGETISVRSFVEIVHQLTGSKSKLIFGAVPYRTGEVMLARADTAYLKSLGWKVNTSLVDGIKKILLDERE